MTTSDTTRRVAFDADGPVDVSVHLGSGSVEIRLREEPGVEVEIRPAPGEANPWAEGIAGLMSWVTSAMGETQPLDVATEAVTQTRVDFGGGALSIRSARGGHLRAVPVAVVVHAPTGSSLTAGTSSAPVTVTGRPARVEIGTGDGEITVEQSTGPIRLTSGTGAIRSGPTPSGAHVRSASGDIDITTLGAPSTLASGSGMIRLGTLTADTQIRTTTGDIAIREARSGTLELTSGSGSFRIGVASPAELDLISTSSVARSEIPITQKRPDHTTLKITGRTGSGTILVHKSG